MEDEKLSSLITYELLDKEIKIRQNISESPIISLVDNILLNAINSKASDIHLEPTESSMRVRFRIDGALYDQEQISFSQRFIVISRLKVLSSLDISEQRLPQDGKIRLKIISPSLNKLTFPIDLRISTFPSIHGEKMVIRILDKSINRINFESLGFSKKIENDLCIFIKKSQGFLLVSGPTGCGKTTTLYSLLSNLNDSTKNIITMEDPVEYNIDGIIQSQVNIKAGFSFENGLRSILRQDPDVIMIGEIRDKLTVQTALQASLTGHLVLSTIHTNDAASTITRLLDMGVEPFLINAALNCVLAQRLVRKLCSYCKEETSLLENEKIYLKSIIGINKVYKPKGCSHCFKTGYSGQLAIGELLILSDNIKELIGKKESTSKIKTLAINEGMIPLINSLAELLAIGTISLEDFYSLSLY